MLILCVYIYYINKTYLCNQQSTHKKIDSSSLQKLVSQLVSSIKQLQKHITKTVFLEKFEGK